MSSFLVYYYISFIVFLLGLLPKPKVHHNPFWACFWPILVGPSPARASPSSGLFSISFHSRPTKPSSRLPFSFKLVQHQLSSPASPVSPTSPFRAGLPFRPCTFQQRAGIFLHVASLHSPSLTTWRVCLDPSSFPMGQDGSRQRTNPLSIPPPLLGTTSRMPWTSSVAAKQSSFCNVQASPQLQPRASLHVMDAVRRQLLLPRAPALPI